VRRYEFVRTSDRKLLVRGETDWVFIDAKSGRPIAIPHAVLETFLPAPDEKTKNRRIDRDHP
jgi:acyl-CoA thioester hydrolase